MKLLVESEISATSYKKLVARLKGLNRKELWEILDHYIFHIMEDKEVGELLALLDQNAAENPKSVEGEVEEPELDSDRFRPIVATNIPSDSELEEGKYFLDLLYDQNCFDNYIDPRIKSLTAKKLVGFAEKNNLPICDHWTENA